MAEEEYKSPFEIQVMRKRGRPRLYTEEEKKRNTAKQALEYYYKHRDIISLKKMNYYYDNREKILQRRKDLYKENKKASN